LYERGLQNLRTSLNQLRLKDWPVLIKEHEFVLIKDQAAYDLPDDFDRLIANTAWDRVEARPMTALSPAQWQEWKSGPVQAEVWKQFRFKHDEGQRKFFVNPTPSTTQCSYECRDGTKVRVGLVFEYVSKYPARKTASAGGTYLERPTSVTDEILLPETAVEADLKWRWLRSLNRPYADEKYEAEQVIETILAQSGTPGVLTAHGARDLPYPNIPETNVGLS
jgi:hypothetical protein